MRALVLGAMMLAGAAPIRGQELSLLFGGTHARYADSLQGTASVASLRLRTGHGSRALDLETGVSQFSTGEWAIQGGAQGIAMVRRGRGIALGVAGGGSLSNFQGGDWSGAAAAGPIVAAGTRPMFMLGASVGGMRTVGDSRLAIGAGSLRVRFAPTPRITADAGAMYTAADNGTRYTDVTSAFAYQRPGFRLAATVGARFGDLADDPWAQLRLELALLPAMRLEAAVGRYPRDLVGFSNGFFVQSGVRLTVSRVAHHARATSRDQPAIRALPEGDRMRVVLRYAGRPAQLGIAGEFSEWQPVPMERVNGDQWEVSLTLAPGIHHYALVADGEWVLPDGVAGVDDGLGLRVGVLIVRN